MNFLCKEIPSNLQKKYTYATSHPWLSRQLYHKRHMHLPSNRYVLVPTLLVECRLTSMQCELSSRTTCLKL